MNSIASDQKIANAFGGKSARACDSCVKKRARWYCAADDAFLCQSCDSSVHAANPLALRHERVRLKTASFKTFETTYKPHSLPTWHKGFTRKPRTPRQKKPEKSISHGTLNPKINNTNPFSFVPEIYSEENSHEENDDQLVYYRVPIFDPFVSELSTSTNNDENNPGFGSRSKPDFSHEMSSLGFLPSEMDLAEFAADVESLLGKGLEDESFNIEGLGLLLDCDDQNDEKEFNNCSLDERLVKVEDDNGELIDVGRETFEINFDYEEENKEQIMEPINIGDDHNNKGNYAGFKKILLRLDYEGVKSAWDDRKSPWMTGERPEIDSGDCWPDCMGTCGTMHAYRDPMMSGHVAAMADGGREARVSRYREKRRTRLFSKKIRYEVRKLNAEKRPRMKGRFVKRANFVSPPIGKFLPRSDMIEL